VDNHGGLRHRPGLRRHAGRVGVAPGRAAARLAPLPKLGVLVRDRARGAVVRRFQRVLVSQRALPARSTRALRVSSRNHHAAHCAGSPRIVAALGPARRGRGCAGRNRRVGCGHRRRRADTDAARERHLGARAPRGLHDLRSGPRLHRCARQHRGHRGNAAIAGRLGGGDRVGEPPGRRGARRRGRRCARRQRHRGGTPCRAGRLHSRGVLDHRCPRCRHRGPGRRVAIMLPDQPGPRSRAARTAAA